MAMAKHLETMDESCTNLWKLLDKLNKEFKGEAKDAEQYHDIIASLYKIKGLEMAAQFEDEQKNGASQRGGSYENGRSGVFYDPMIHSMAHERGSYDGNGYYRQGGSYNRSNGSYNTGDSYAQGGSYNQGGSYEGSSYARYQPRNERGQFKADGRANRGGSYHSQDEMIQELREKMQDADPDTKQAYKKVIRDMQWD